MTAKQRRISTRVWVAGVVLLAAAAGAYASTRHEPVAVGPPCRAVIGDTSVSFTREQAQNGTTIAAVGKRLGMPNHAVTVALATALQESNLYNLDYGDLDSVGLFQQRPSQGWGTVEQIMSPRFSANAFYVHLARINNWAAMSTNDAAQAVQRSAFPDAYGKWEEQARTAAIAMTGEQGAAFTCRAELSKDSVLSSNIDDDLRKDAGNPVTEQTVTEARGWMIASWLVARAEMYNVRSIAFNGQRWTAATGVWEPFGSPSLQVVVG